MGTCGPQSSSNRQERTFPPTWKRALELVFHKPTAVDGSGSQHSNMAEQGLEDEALVAAETW